MEGFRPTAHHERLCGDRRADRVCVQQLTAGLQTTTHKGIRRGAQQQVVGLGVLHQLFSILHVNGQRLFAVHVFAGFQRRHAYGGVLVGDGQVQHNVNVGVSQQFVHCHGFGTKLFGAGLRCLHTQVCAGNKLQITKPFRDIFCIHLTDHAAADHANFTLFHLAQPPFYFAFHGLFVVLSVLYRGVACQSIRRFHEVKWRFLSNSM